ncbi:MAG: hypothetical protein WC261_09070 [Synergistaceae bacterium]|jgi:hypothetical protein
MGAEVAKVERADLGRDQKPAGNAESASMAKTAQKIDSLPTKRKPHKPYNRKYDRNKVKALAEMGVKATDIANALDVNVSTITRYLDKIGIQAREIAQYKSNKADLLALSQLKASAIADKIMDTWVEEPERVLSQDIRTQKEVLIAVNSVKTYDNNSTR